MENSGGKILFWGPQCVGYWNQYFCAPVFERLKPFGWSTSYYFPPVNEFGTGLDRAWPTWYPHYDPLPNYTILEELGRSVYLHNTPSDIANALEKPLKHENPDVIITRTNGHDYLHLLFPGTPILTMGEAMGSPWFEQHCFSLSAHENFHGLPHLGQHPEQALDLSSPGPDVTATFNQLSRMCTVSDEDRRAAEFYFQELRQKYDRVYLFPTDYTGAECLYLFNQYPNERFTSNADILHYIKHETDERTAIIVTQHPLQAKRQNTTTLSDIFHPDGRIITIDNSRLASRLFKTSLLAHFADGLIVRNSKSFWYAIANEKPILNLGTQDLSAIGAYKDLLTFMQHSTAQISHSDALKVFYWQTTRQRIALRENKKISKMLSHILEQSQAVTDLKESPNLFEWGTEADYQASFKHCTDTYNMDFYFP